MELIGNFGIDPRYLAAQIVNFLIIFYLLKRFAYKPILEVLKNRENAIKEGLKQAEEARILLEKASEREKEILRTANQEARKLLNEAKKQKEELFEKSDEAAKKQAQAIILEARAQISQESKEAEKRLTSHISRLALEFLQKSISELFSNKEQQYIMKNAIKKLRKESD